MTKAYLTLIILDIAKTTSKSCLKLLTCILPSACLILKLLAHD